MQLRRTFMPYVFAGAAALYLLAGACGGNKPAEFKASFDCRNAPREYRGAVAPPYGSVPNSQIAYTWQTRIPSDNQVGLPSFAEKDGIVTVTMQLRKALPQNQADELKKEAAKASGCVVQ